MKNATNTCKLKQNLTNRLAGILENCCHVTYLILTESNNHFKALVIDEAVC